MSDQQNRSIDGTIQSQLESASETVLVVHPSPPIFEILIDLTTGYENLPSIQLMGAETTMKEAVDDFLVACRAADAIADDILELRITKTAPENQLVITEQQLTALVTADDSTVSITTTDSTDVATVTDHYTRIWEEADMFSFRTPPLTRLLETLRTEFHDEIADDFNTVLNAADAIPRTGNDLDEVSIALLVAANHQELFYEISKWGEDVGLASKATFSRTKTALENQGVIATEKVPIDVGRPRLRLLLADQELRDASIENLLTLAQNRF